MLMYHRAILEVLGKRFSFFSMPIVCSNNLLNDTEKIAC
jgi:hypothetical protein